MNHRPKSQVKEATAKNSKGDKWVRYVDLLRGIDPASHKQVRMEDLRKLLESMGFKNVRTILNSGNVVFDAQEASKSTLVKQIEEALTKAFGYEIPVILRAVREIQEMVDSNPFEKVKVTPDTRLYVTFLSEKPRSSIRIPYESPERDLKILTIQDGAVFHVVTLETGRGTTGAMAALEKLFGKRVTTRNWNTVIKMLKN